MRVSEFIPVALYPVREKLMLDIKKSAKIVASLRWKTSLNEWPIANLKRKSETN